MATATLPNQALKDHVYVVFEQSWLALNDFYGRRQGDPPRNVQLLPIGLAFEHINSGHARIDPRSKDQFEAFKKSAEASVARTAARIAARNAEYEKSHKGEPTDKARREAAQFNRK